jgi:flagellar protein FliS
MDTMKRLNRQGGGVPAPKNPYTEYEAVQFNTASQPQLILMTYDGAIRFTKEAKKRIMAKDISGKGLCIDRAFAAIAELRNSLNLGEGRDVAQSLNNLYYYLTKQLSRANLDNDIEPLDVVIEILTGLRDAWNELFERMRSE